MRLATVIPSLLSSDLARTTDFYRRLGFERTGTYPDPLSPSWIELARGDVVFQFYREPPIGTPEGPVFSGTLYIACSDVDTLAGQLQGKVDFEWGPETMDYGQREFAVRDPDGYRLAFAQLDRSPD
ncbi:VOC family protein [Halomonas denitrificans]|nr:VOC family protein [Halomonas denitrificans]